MTTLLLAAITSGTLIFSSDLFRLREEFTTQTVRWNGSTHRLGDISVTSGPCYIELTPTDGRAGE